MATTNLAVELATDGTWTPVCGASLTNVQLVSLPNAWEIRIAASLPDPSAAGTPVTSSDGSWGSSGLDVADIIYARPLVDISGARPALVVSGFWN